MKNIFLTLIILIGFSSHAQNVDQVSVERVIKTFYDGFNAKDSIKMQKMLSKDFLYQDVDEVYGKKVVKTEDISTVIKTIASIPNTTQFRQELGALKVNVDGQIANVWVDYKFYLYDAYYHCGVSSFQLVKEDGGWKIISLLDHHSKEACK
ncbi:MAG: nuclear transport factor 2 family protein [Saonia sp.]